MNLPKNHTRHDLENNCVAYTIPTDGFHKLIAFETPKKCWVHKSYRKTKKKNKKNR